MAVAHPGGAELGGGVGLGGSEELVHVGPHRPVLHPWLLGRPALLTASPA